MQCAECGKSRVRSTPCAACRREKQWVGPNHGSNRAALEEQIDAMATGREHRALVESCRVLADVVDALEVFDDKAWREYRLALAALREATGDNAPDSFESLTEELRAKVPDSEDS